MIKTVFFDLDGTLLPMEQDVFTKEYFSRLAAWMAPYGYESKSLIEGVWAGTAAMVKNDGKKTNEEVFWKCFSDIFGAHVYKDIPKFEEFYRTDFQNAKSVCGFWPESAQTLSAFRERGIGLVLASNPVFPKIAQESRLCWAGVDPSVFEYLTSYENSSFCKPNPKYYEEILSKLSLSPKECLMVGNDAREDLAAEKIGMSVFILDPCLINRDAIDLSSVPHGDFQALKTYLDQNHLLLS